MEKDLARTPSYSSQNGHTLCESFDGDKNHNGKNGTRWSRFMEFAFPGGYCKELKSTMTIAWALVISQICQIWFQPIATIFGGHLGKLELDAIALANTLINVLGNSIVIGFCTALDTVFSQTYGRGNYEMVGIYFQKGLILTFLLLMPCFALHLNIEPILIGLGQDPEVSRLVGLYMLYFMPGMFCLFMWTTIRKFTQCQNAVTPHIIIILIGHAIHAVLQYLFLYQFGLGILGSAFAQGIVFFVLLVTTIIYTLKSAEYKLSWKGFDRRCLHGWGELGVLGVHGMLMLCLEWWAFEISVIVAGTIGTTELAAQSVTFNLNTFCFAAPSGLAVATSIRIGQLLGSKEILKAKTAARVGMTITAVNATVWMVIFATARFEIPKIFTNEQDVIDMVSSILPYLSVFAFGDAITTIGRGVFRGAGKQLWGTVIILIAYYLIAVPTGLSLTFLTSMSIRGLWLGFTTAICISGVTYFVIINVKLNWAKLADEAALRAFGKASGHVKKHTKVKEEEKQLLISNGSDYEDLEMKVTTGLIVKRILVVLVFVLMFVAGLIARLLTGDIYKSSGEELTTNSTMMNATTMTSYHTENITNFHSTTSSLLPL